MSTYKGLPTNIGPLPKSFEQHLTPYKSSIPKNWLNKNALVGTHIHEITKERYLKDEKGYWIKENLNPDSKSKKQLPPNIPTTKYPCSALPPATPRLDKLPSISIRIRKPPFD